MDIYRNSEYKDTVDANAVQGPKDSPMKIWLIIGCSVLIGLLTIIPFLYDLRISFLHYDFFTGIPGSKFAGFSQYIAFIQSADFVRLFWNTVRSGLIYGIFLMIFTIIGGGIIGALPFRGIVRNAAITLVLIPLFIPDAVFVSWFVRFQGEIIPLNNNSAILWFIPLIRALKYMGIPIFAASVIGERRKSKTLSVPVQAGVCFILLSFMFTLGSDFNFSWLVSNLFHNGVDSFELYALGSAFMTGDVSLASVVLMVRQVLSLIAIAIFFVPFWFIGKKLFAVPLEQEMVKELELSKRIISSGIALLLWIVFVGGIMMIKGMNPGEGAGEILPQSLELIPTLLLYTVLAGVAAVIQVILSAIIGYLAVCGTRVTRKIGMAFIIILSVVSSLPFTIGQYMIMSNMRINDSFFAVLSRWIFPTAGVWVIFAICHMQRVKDGKSYCKAIVFPMVGLLFVQIVSNLNNTVLSILYMADESKMSPMMQYWMRGREYAFFDGVVFWYSMVLSIIPIGICIGLRVFCSEQTMFSILGMGAKR